MAFNLMSVLTTIENGLKTVIADAQAALTGANSAVDIAETVEGFVLAWNKDDAEQKDQLVVASISRITSDLVAMGVKVDSTVTNALESYADSMLGVMEAVQAAQPAKASDIPGTPE
jgi:hypothetical protein